MSMCVSSPEYVLPISQLVQYVSYHHPALPLLIQRVFIEYPLQARLYVIVDPHEVLHSQVFLQSLRVVHAGAIHLILEICCLTL